MSGDGLAFSPTYHRSNIRRPLIEVCGGDDRLWVNLTLEGEAEGDPSTERMLLPEEARMLAAALLHFAAEMER